MTKTSIHQPALLHQSLKALNIKPGFNYLDCTVGGGGHSEAILKLGGRLYGLDVDPQAIKRTQKHLQQACPNAFFKLACANFSQLIKAADSFKLQKVSGILMDLGLSSDQLADKKHGFSFQFDSPLDMRADPSLAVTAADLVNGLGKSELILLFKKYGEEPYSQAIVNRLLKKRQLNPIKTTRQLTELIAQVKPQKGKINPATQVFQALRIAVNDELNNLKQALPQAVKLLESHGRLAVISFHSLEDRLVKQFINSNSNQLVNLTKKPVIPSERQIETNPRSRSAKLRVAEKI